MTFTATGRMFVWERAGRVWFRDPGETNFTQLLNISEEVANWGDHGCLGFALDPNFNVNGNIYLLYVVDTHYLLNFGTGNYNANSNLTFAPTIGRVTRYSCTSSNNFRSVDLASRFILIGDSKTNGFPVTSDAHGVGSLVFGTDGSLLVSCGDLATAYQVDTGGVANGSFANQAVTDGILRVKENVGGYRAQLVDCHNGKVLRIDPATGEGYPSNPFYDATKPKAAKSRVWALGCRNPFRMALRPGTGSHDPADGNPGSLYIGNVGWDDWESLQVCNGPRQNFGWPLFDGLDITPDFVLGGTYNVDVNNLDATNAAGCSTYFSFRQLLKQDTTNAALFPPFTNPCNSALKITNTIPQFIRRRPVLDWNHLSPITRVPLYSSTGAAISTNLGVAGSGVSGTQFQGNCAIGGTWYTATNSGAFPTQYYNTYFMADWDKGYIRNLTFTTNDVPTSVSDFATGSGALVSLVQHPTDGSLYYVTYNYGDAGTVRQLSYTGNRTPVAVITADQFYGAGPLTVQFTGSGSSDPDGQTISYSWNFGDGTALSTAANPSHVFTASGSVPTNYTVTLTVTDSGGLPASATMNIAVNDTPPSVTITSPTNATLYSMVSNTPFNLTATVFDAESSDSQLKYSWVTLLRHNEHSHVNSASTNHTAATLVEPIGCDGINIYYVSVVLTVTDPNGLATTRTVDLFPNCGTTDTPPTITDITNQSTTLNVPTATLPFTIGDAQVAAANLQLRGGSSNPALVPTNNIVFGGFGANRTVTVTPAPNLNGTATISVTVNDGPNNVTDTFLLTVTGSNTPPTISSLTNQTTAEGTPIVNAFTVNDANTLPGNLFLSGGASDPVLVPTNNIVFGGSGSNRTVTVLPAAGQTGSTTVTVGVSDGALSASNSFTVTVTSLPAGTRSFTNATAIAISDNTAASPYPSVINVSGLGGAVTNVTLTLRSFSHDWGRDVEALLVGPAGQKLLFMSDAGTGPTVTNGNLTFSDAAASFLVVTGHVAAGTYKPTDYEPGDTMPAPAPAGPYATNLSVFNGQIANGAWSLYVADDGSGDAGNIAGGWSLTVATAASGPQPPTITAIADQTTLTNTPTAALAFTISDSDTPIGSLTLSNTSSNPTLVPTNNIVFGGSVSNRTVTVTPAADQSGTATISVFVSDGTNVTSDTFLLTVVTAFPQTLSFTNAAGIGIRDTNGALPYPATITVAGMSGIISNVTATLRGFNQTWGSDVDVLLVGPAGQKMILMSDAGSGSVTSATLVFSDAATLALPTAGLTSGTYRPTNYTDASPLGDNFPSPAPAGPYATNLATFNGTAPNGTWSLYVFDDGPGDTGTITNGWSLTITTLPGSSSNTAPTLSGISNQVTVVNTPTTALPFTISDAETASSNLVLSVFTSNAGLVPTNQIVLGGSGTNRTVTVTPASNQLGSATISLNVSDGSLIASNSFVVTVNPAVLTVTENSASRGYGLTNPVLTGSISGLQAGDVITASYSSVANTNSPVGAYLITFTLNDPGSKLGNYVITTNNAPLTVTNALLTVSANSTNKIYGVTKTFAGTEFTITSGTLYNGNTLTNVTLASGGTNAAAGVGSYAITVTNALGAGLSNYLVGYSNGTLTVGAAALTVTANSTNKIYGSAKTFAGTEFTITGGTLFNGNTLTNVALASAGAGTNAAAGSYLISAALAAGLGLTNYTITYSNGTLTVGVANLLITAGSTNKIYGATLNPAVFTAGGLLNGDTVTNVALSSAGSVSNAAVGSYAINAGGAGGAGLTNYSIAYSNGTLTVGAANLLVTALDTNKIYGASLVPAAFTATGLLNGDSVTNVTLASLGSVSNAAVGGYAINASAALGTGLTNYSVGYSNGTLTVAAANLLVTADNTNKVYGSILNPAGFGVTGLLNGDSVTNATLTSAGGVSNAPVGGYAINASAAQGSGLTNYTIGYSNGTLTVGAANVLITAGNTNKVYGATLTPAAFTASGLLNGDSVTSVSLASAGCVSNAALGGYPISASGALGVGLANYTLGYSNGTLMVGAANLLITAGNTNKVYGATLTPAAFTASGLLNSDAVTNVTLNSAGSVSNASVGGYAITASGASGAGLGNYTIGYSNGTLTVTQAVLVATADDQSRAYGQPNPAFTISYAGFVNGEGTNVLDILPGAGSTATNTSASGGYVITVTGGTDDNYAISHVNGLLTVVAPGPVTITSVEFLDAVNLRLVGTGDANVSYKVEASADLLSWTEIGTALSNGGGAFEFVDGATAGFPARYYRIAMP